MGEKSLHKTVSGEGLAGHVVNKNKYYVVECAGKRMQSGGFV